MYSLPRQPAFLRPASPPLGRALSSSILGKCNEIEHFLDFRGIPAENSQPKHLIPFEMKKSVSLVSPVSTVSFCRAYNGRHGLAQITGSHRRDAGRQPRQRSEK